LFYRAAGFPDWRCPLFENEEEDISLLVEYFIDRYARKSGASNFKNIEKRTLQVLQSYPWPGNIRELQNVIETFGDPLRGQTFSRSTESWLPLPLPATESKAPH